MVDEEHGEQDGEIGKRSQELIARPPLTGISAQAFEAVREEERSRNDRRDEITHSSDAERDEKQRYRDQRGRIEHDVAARLAFARGPVRQDGKSRTGEL